MIDTSKSKYFAINMTRVQGLFSKTVNSKSKITSIKAKNDDMFLLVYYPETAQTGRKSPTRFPEILIIHYSYNVLDFRWEACFK